MSSLFYSFLFCYFIKIVKNESLNCYEEPGIMKLHACCDIPFTNVINEKCKLDLIKKSRNDTNIEYKISRSEMVFEMCSAECEFQTKNYLHSNNEINFDVVKNDLEHNYPHQLDYITSYIKGFHDCMEYAKEAAKRYAAEQTLACNYFPGLLRKCAFHAAIRNCSTERWHSSETCNNLKNWLEICYKARKV